MKARAAGWVGLVLGSWLLPEVVLHPERILEGASRWHPLGFDSLGRESLCRLGYGCLRTFGWSAWVSFLGLVGGGLLAVGRGRWEGSRAALRSAPPLLLVLLVSAAAPPLGWAGLGFLVSALLTIHLEPPLRLRLQRFREGPALQAQQTLGASPGHRLRIWAPWLLAQARPLVPMVWVGTVYLEVALRLLGLGPGPQEDSLGLVLAQELPTFISEPSALGLAALGVVLALAWWLSAPLKEHA